MTSCLGERQHENYLSTTRKLVKPSTLISDSLACASCKVWPALVQIIQFFSPQIPNEIEHALYSSSRTIDCGGYFFVGVAIEL